MKWDLYTPQNSQNPSANAREMLEEAFHNHLICTRYNGTAMGGSLVCDLNTKHFWQRTTHHPSSSSGARLFKNNRLSSFSSLCQFTFQFLAAIRALIVSWKFLHEARICPKNLQMLHMFFTKILIQTPCCPDTQEYLSSYHGETSDMTLKYFFSLSAFFVVIPHISLNSLLF